MVLSFFVSLTHRPDHRQGMLSVESCHLYKVVPPWLHLHICTIGGSLHEYYKFFFTFVPIMSHIVLGGAHRGVSFGTPNLGQTVWSTTLVQHIAHSCMHHWGLLVHVPLVMAEVTCTFSIVNIIWWEPVRYLHMDLQSQILEEEIMAHISNLPIAIPDSYTMLPHFGSNAQLPPTTHEIGIQWLLLLLMSHTGSRRRSWCSCGESSLIPSSSSHPQDGLEEMGHSLGYCHSLGECMPEIHNNY